MLSANWTATKNQKSTADCLCPGREAPVEERYPRVLTVETSLKVQFSWSTITDLAAVVVQNINVDANEPTLIMYLSVGL